MLLIPDLSLQCIINHLIFFQDLKLIFFMCFSFSLIFLRKKRQKSFAFGFTKSTKYKLMVKLYSVFKNSQIFSILKVIFPCSLLLLSNRYYVPYKPLLTLINIFVWTSSWISAFLYFPSGWNIFIVLLLLSNVKTFPPQFL